MTHGRQMLHTLGALACAAALTGCGLGGGKDNAPTDPTQQGPAQTPAQLDLLTSVDGAPAEGSAINAQALELQFSLGGKDAAIPGLTLQGFECRFGAAPDFAPCSAPFVISGLRDGELYALTVRAVLKVDATGDVVYAKEASFSFKVSLAVGVPGAPVPPNPIRALSSTLQVGSAFQMAVPAGLHVTEYSTSKTTGVLSFFRILPDSDPYYLGNFGCGKDWDRVVASVSPAGEALMYCHSTPTRAAYKQEHEYRLAHNHVEIATDTRAVAAENHERLSVSIYDADYELMTQRSRFNNACLNSKRDFITVPMLNNFFLGKNPEHVDFWYCDTYLPDMSGKPQLWRIGAFFDVDHIDWSCTDCRYPRAVEAVYMVRANAAVFTPELFAKVAQKRILDVLTKVTP